MSYNHPEIKTFKGLYIQQNSFAVPDGALETANNVVISQDGVITKRRGFSLFSSGITTSINSLHYYQGKLLSLYGNRIAWLSTSGVQTDLTGVTVSETGGRTGRSVQSNSNFYVTTDNGAIKLEAYSGSVQTSGTPSALDLRSRTIAEASEGVVKADTQVAHRVTFGRTDSNGNLLESAPSDIAVIANNPVSAAASWNATTVTVTSTAHGLFNGQDIVVSNAASSGTPVMGLDGTYTATVTGANTFTYPNTAAAGSGTLDYSYTVTPRLEFTVPSEITGTDYFYRIYRTSQTLDATVEVSLNFKLIKQATLSAAELASRIVFFTDTVVDAVRGGALELYTNPNSQEGELQANTRPPLSSDVTLYKNHVLYANTVSRHNLEIALVDSSLINSGDFLEVKLDATTLRFVFRDGVGNATVHGTASGTSTVTVHYVAHGFATGHTVYVSNVTGTVPEGLYTITRIDNDNFSFVSTGNTATELDFEGVTDGTNYQIQLNGVGATGIDATARGIVRAINRNAASLIYARYIANPTDFPGLMYFEAKGFGSGFSFRISAAGATHAFSPVLPTSFGGGIQISSSNDTQPNAVFFSKTSEPESVPIVNNLLIGSKDKAILRIFALRDCVIIVKEDGIFRLDGDNSTNFISTVLDSTVFCLVASSAALIDNTVIMLSNQGIVKISSSAVQIISYKIEQVIRPILGISTLAAQTSAVAYESERLYLISTLEPNTTTATTVYCYNTLSDAWTTWDTLFSSGIVGFSDNLFLLNKSNNIARERKNQNKLDYCDQDYSATVVSVAADKLSAVINFGSLTPAVNDIVVLNNVINRIKKVVVNGGNFTVTFYQTSNLVAGPVTYYPQYTATIKFAPFHAGAVNRAKQFSQFQAHLRDPGASVMDISFSSDSLNSSELVSWTAYASGGATGGFGLEPWGFFPFGDPQGIDLTYTTKAAPIIRTYVPRFAQRSTFIQATLTHATAGERLGIQEIGYTVRGYGERVSK